MTGNAGVTRSAVALLDPTYRRDTLTRPRADWPSIKALFNALKDDRDRGVFDADRWQDFVTACAATESRPPYHLHTIVEAAKTVAHGHPRAAVKGIDHGCGSGLNILYLHALGFTGLRGVNIVPDCLAWNEWLKTNAGYDHEVFALYDGRRLPAEESSQDFVFSQQVVEHVEPSLIESYYAEEGRVLRDGGLAVHQAPHRLSPYDGHTRTWLVHWLPRRLQIALYRVLGRDAEWAERELFLRSPGRHRRLVRRWIGPLRDETRERITRLGQAEVASYYDGPAQLRLFLGKVSAVPFAGKLAARVIAPWLMAETIAVKDMVSASAARPSRQFVFLLSDHVIDFDTYLPVAVALKRARPEFDIRFVTFSRDNHDFILANPTLVAGLRQSGELILLDRAAGNRLLRQLRTLGVFLRIAAWLGMRPGSVLFHGRQFSEGPYAILYLLNRLLGGKGILLARSRQPDAGIKTNILPRFQNNSAEGIASRVARFIGRDHDGFIHYHDAQDLYLRTLRQWGRIDIDGATRMGLPNLLPEWQSLLDKEMTQARRQLREEGFNADEIYAVFAPKSFSSKYLRLPDSGERSFRMAIEALKALRPDATILVRPHPRAMNEPWLVEAIRDIAHPRLKMTLLHPELLCALARRTIAPNNTTTMMIAAEGRYIDCTDYAADHYETLGERSLCDGYNCIFVNPSKADFVQRFAAALQDDAWNASLSQERDELIRRNPPRLDLLLDVIEGVRA